MGQAKNWSAEEAEAASKAHVAATHDSVNGSGQKSEDFAARVHECFEEVSPPGEKDAGTHSDHDPGGKNMKVWHCVRDTILKDAQKFNGRVNLVVNMGLSGVTHQQKIDVAAALCLRKTADGESHCACKNFEANRWRLCKAWVVLKDTEKAAAPAAVERPSDKVTLDLSGDKESLLTDSSKSPSL